MYHLYDLKYVTFLVTTIVEISSLQQPQCNALKKPILVKVCRPLESINIYLLR